MAWFPGPGTTGARTQSWSVEIHGFLGQLLLSRTLITIKYYYNERILWIWPATTAFNSKCPASSRKNHLLSWQLFRKIDVFCIQNYNYKVNVKIFASLCVLFFSPTFSWKDNFTSSMFSLEFLLTWSVLGEMSYSLTLTLICNQGKKYMRVFF